MANKTVGYTESRDFTCLEDMDQAYTLVNSKMITLSYCGKENCASGWTFGPHVRENYVIHVVTNGKGIYSIGDKDYEVSKDQMFIIYPGENTIYRADKEDPWSYIWIGFKGILAEAITTEMGFQRDRLIVNVKDTKPIEESIDKMLKARQFTHADALKRSAAFLEALSQIMQNSAEYRAATNHPEAKYVNRAVDYINAHYAEKIKVAELADMIGINRSYFTSIFKKYTQQSPQEYLIDLRLEKAAQMLRETEEPVGSIASAVGYADALAFSKAFRKKYDETPREFRVSKPEIDNKDERGAYQIKRNL